MMNKLDRYFDHAANGFIMLFSLPLWAAVAFAAVCCAPFALLSWLWEKVGLQPILQAKGK